MIKFLPKKVIAAIIIVLGYSKIFLKKYGITLFFILLSIFLAYKCYSYKQLAEEFERQVRDLDNYATELEEKQEAEENKKPAAAGIDIEALKKQHKISSKDLYIPEEHRTHKEVYFYQEPQKIFIPTQSENYNYRNQEEELQKQRDKAIEERRIMELESKVNHYELERDMRLLNY